MKEQTRYKVECQNNYWYFSNKEEAVEFAKHWDLTCSGVTVEKVIESLLDGLVKSKVSERITYERLQ